MTVEAGAQKFDPFRIEHAWEHYYPIVSKARDLIRSDRALEVTATRTGCDKVAQEAATKPGTHAGLLERKARAMAWEFETDPEFQQELDWIDEFVREEIEPLDFIIASPYDLTDPVRNEIIRPLQKVVQDRKLWACHLGPDLGGPGYGQVKLALMNEILGRARCASTIFGTQAPDTGNSEILAHFGTP
ncbi:hypothetical protein GQR58_030636 [Nymphon striatum]|nr:hypothetical protein GQR58_030636 [Nymphon striatum]